MEAWLLQIRGDGPIRYEAVIKKSPITEEQYWQWYHNLMDFLQGLKSYLLRDEEPAFDRDYLMFLGYNAKDHLTELKEHWEQKPWELK